MTLIDKIKPFIKEDANTSELGKILDTATTLTPETVKEWVSKSDNKSTFDYIAQQAVDSHVERERGNRIEWETKKSAELLTEAMSKIEKDKQKTPEMIRIDELTAKLQLSEESQFISDLTSQLLNIVKTEKLPIHNVEPFLSYKETAAEKMKTYAEANKTLIDDLVKKQIADKFGNGKMSGGDEDKNKDDDKPVSTEDFLKESLARPANITP